MIHILWIQVNYGYYPYFILFTTFEFRRDLNICLDTHFMNPVD